MNKAEKLIIDFANAAGMMASRFSISPTAGQIYGLLYMSKDPVSLNEMVEKLGISKGSASTNVRALESWGAVKKVWVDNSRKDYYEANLDTLNIIISRLKEGIERRFEDARGKIENIETEYSSVKSPEEALFQERLERIKEMYDQVRTLLGFLPDKGQS